MRSRMGGMSHLFSWRILPGLSGEGPPAVQFSATGRGTHREGIVVEFTLEGRESWTGNFQPGIKDFSMVLVHPSGLSALVIACGEGYLVDPQSHILIDLIGGGFLENALPLPDLDLLILHDGVSLMAIDPTGIRWRSRRVSWDGIWDLQLRDGLIEGLSFDVFTDSDVPFRLDLTTGTVTGGAYRE